MVVLSSVKYSERNTEILDGNGAYPRILWWPLILIQILAPLEFQPSSITCCMLSGNAGVKLMVFIAPTGAVTTVASALITSPFSRVIVAPAVRWAMAVTGVFDRMLQLRSSAMAL